LVFWCLADREIISCKLQNTDECITVKKSGVKGSELCAHCSKSIGRNEKGVARGTSKRKVEEEEKCGGLEESALIVEQMGMNKRTRRKAISV
jgi:hypothetical protein